MPLYFFDSDYGDHTFPDLEGSELADDAAARLEAAVTFGEMARELFPRGGPAGGIEMLVRRGDGTRLVRLNLTFTITDENDLVV